MHICPPTQVSVAEDDPNRPYLSVAGEIHLLMAAPEMIWSAVDSGALLRAASLYLFARHVHTGLALEERAEGVTAAQERPGERRNGNLCLNVLHNYLLY